MDCKEKEERRKRNREAARKCREKKVQEAETLKQDKEELERDNCELVKQRNQLRERCFALEEKLRRHKEEGCLISECSPSHGDLSNILDPSCPPSPSLIGPQSPGLSLVRLPLSGRSQLAYEVDAVPVKRKKATTAACGQFGEVTHPMVNSPPSADIEQNSWTAIREMKTEPAAPPAPVQEAVLSVQGRSLQAYPLRVRVPDGSLKDLLLSREDYFQVLQNLKASKESSAQQHGQRSSCTAARSASSPPPPQLDSTPQARHIPPGFISVDQSVQSCTQSDVCNSDGLDSCTDITEEESTDFLLISPDDMFIKDEEMVEDYGQKNFAFSEDTFAAVQHPGIVCSEGGNVQVFSSQHRSADHPLRPASGADPVPSSQHLHFLQTGNVSKTAQTEQSSARCILAAGELSRSVTSQEAAFPKVEPGAPFTVTTTGSVSLPLGKPTPISSHELPFLRTDELQVLKKPSFSDFRKVPELQEPSLDSISAMKTVRLRPKANQLLASRSRVPAAFQTPRTSDDLSQSAVQQVPQLPAVPVSHSNPQGTQGFSVESMDSVQVWEPVQSGPMTESTRAILEYLAASSLEVMQQSESC